MVVALDRSGSMAKPIGGGRTKVDLANLGTCESRELLTAVFHRLPKQSVDTSMVTRALRLEPIKNVRIDPNRQRFLDRPIELPNDRFAPGSEFRNVGYVDFSFLHLLKFCDFLRSTLCSFCHKPSFHFESLCERK